MDEDDKTKILCGGGEGDDERGRIYIVKSRERGREGSVGEGNDLFVGGNEGEPLTRKAQGAPGTGHDSLRQSIGISLLGTTVLWRQKRGGILLALLLAGRANESLAC